MDARTRDELRVHVLEKLREIRENCDHGYVLSLSRDDLAQALEGELYFLGLCRAEDTEARALLQTVVAEQLQDWRAALTARR